MNYQIVIVNRKTLEKESLGIEEFRTKRECMEMCQAVEDLIGLSYRAYVCSSQRRKSNEG